MEKENQLIEEDIEIALTSGTAPVQLPGKIISIFPALAHRNFQLYVFGQAISLIGFWLQQVAIGWLVFLLTNSVFWVGAAAAVGGLPFLFFTTFVGVFVDKVDKRKLLIWTQVAEAVVAITLGVLVLFEKANLELVLLLFFISGTIAAIDLPARLTFIVEMVGKRDLASAIPINNGLFNAARFIGPAIAGALIVSFGVGWPFILNGLSFIAGIWAIIKIRPIYSFSPDHANSPMDSLKEGIKYAFTHPKILYFIILGFVSAVFVWPYQTLMPPVAEKVFSSGPSGLGSLLAATGAGSLMGAVFVSANSRKENKISFVMVGILISTISLILFSVNRNFALAHVLLFFSGFGMLTQVSTVNTLVQLASPDQMRARIMAVYLTMFIGMMPLGNALAGTVAHYTSALFSIGLGAAVSLLVGATFYFKGIFTNLSKT
ncbi:MFS transporter [Candidatus Curtissbacteria bacterium]|nr:MFS transporter [Candidatus Curtissbacteria bacterium]